MIDALSSCDVIAGDNGSIAASSANSQFSFSRRDLAAVFDLSFIFSSLQFVKIGLPKIDFVQYNFYYRVLNDFESDLNHFKCYTIRWIYCGKRIDFRFR